MNVLSEILNKTEQLISILKTDIDRDEKLRLIDQLLMEREQLLKELKPPFLNDEKVIGKKINELNNELNKLLNREKMLIQKDINSLNKKRESSAKYANPYELMNIDGVFYDKRK